MSCTEDQKFDILTQFFKVAMCSEIETRQCLSCVDKTLPQEGRAADLSISPDGPHYLKTVGNIDFLSVGVNCLACVFRAASKTIHDWKSQFDNLVLLAERHLPLRRWSDGYLSPAHWGSAPFVANLNAVYSVTHTNE